MKNALPASRVWITASALFMMPPGFAAASAATATAAAGTAPTEAAVRKADSEWALAAHAGGIDAWTSFYAAATIVRLPHEPLASGKDPVHHTVARFLALPHLSVASHPSDGEAAVAGSGDLVLLTDGYELRFNDPHGAPVSEHGRRLELWKRQADGRWKCIVDTWTPDEPQAIPRPAPPVAAAPAAAPAAVPAAVPAAALTVGVPAPESGPPAPRPESTTKYGDMPVGHEALIRKYFLEHLKHPESVRYRQITQPEHGYTTEITGGLLMREKRLYGWMVKATVDAQDSHGSYVGLKTYTFLFRGEKIVGIRLPLPGDEGR